MSPRKKRWLIVLSLLTVAVGAGLSFWLFREQELPDEPEITISRETTFLTEPLDADGYIDYAEAINRRYGKGVTPENNAAVLLIRAFGPQQFEGTPFQKMGIQPPPKEGRYFVAQGDFGELLRERGQKITDEKLVSQFLESEEKPWTRTRDPAVAAWIEHNRAPLELILAASRKSRFFIPYDKTMGVSIGALSAIRSCYRILICRAMLWVEESQVNKAMDDLLACRRLARLFGQQPDLTASLISLAGLATAWVGDAALIQSGKLSSKQASEYRRALQELKPVSNLDDVYAFASRCESLRSTAAFARKDLTFQDITSAESTKEQERFWEKHRRRVRLGMIDWNAILRYVNHLFDKAVAAAGTDDLGKRDTILKELEGERDRLAKEERKLKDYLSHWRIRDSDRRGVTRWFQYHLCKNFADSLKASLEAQDRESMRFFITLTALGLAAYQKDHGKYPETLAALVPKYIEAVPIDRFNGKPLRYGRSKTGFYLYSVGPNRTDNGGLSDGQVLEKESENHDDILIRVPPRPDNESVD